MNYSVFYEDEEDAPQIQTGRRTQRRLRESKRICLGRATSGATAMCRLEDGGPPSSRGGDWRTLDLTESSHPIWRALRRVLSRDPPSYDKSCVARGGHRHTEAEVGILRPAGVRGSEPPAAAPESARCLCSAGAGPLTEARSACKRMWTCCPRDIRRFRDAAGVRALPAARRQLTNDAWGSALFHLRLRNRW